MTYIFIYHGEKILNDVVCVWVGDKYSKDYVINLYNGVRKHTTLPFRFNVITDKPEIANDIPCRTLPLPDWKIDGVNLLDHRKAWWYKMAMFRPTNGFDKYVLYFDLDLVIIKNIDHFYMYHPKQFCILQDFNRQYIHDFHVSNSSIMRWQTKRYSQSIWEEFTKDIPYHIKTFRGDQDFMTHYFKTHRKNKTWWPREWAMSWKWELEKGGKRNNGTDRNSYHEPDRDFVLPDDCAVVVCHGDPKPHEIHKKILKRWRSTP